MRQLITPVLATLIAAFAVAASAQNAPVTGRADLKTATGASAGTATLTESSRGLLVRLDLKGLPPGWHGLHFHEKGDCSAADFTSAGGHVHAVNPATHGLLNPEGNDSGDLPNILIAADGTASVELFSSFVSLKAAGRPVLMDADGSAVVVHANPDDYKAQPIGNAGGRIACGVVR
jgi:Cu-Zn family superoxide dismutase